VPSIKKNNVIPVVNIYYNMEFKLFICFPGEHKSPSKNTISMEGTWNRGRSEKSLQCLSSRGRDRREVQSFDCWYCM
jgi:hypothetical protein